MIELFAAFVVLLLLLNGLLIARVWYTQRKMRDAQRTAEETEHRLREYRDSNAKRAGSARATLKGMLAEQIAPLLPGFPFIPSDFRFLGQPIDFVVFNGLSEAKEGLGDIEEVVLGDIKMGGAKLSPHQRMIKRAVEEGRVRWVTLHVDPEFCLTER